jgi:hypothetical protein
VLELVGEAVREEVTQEPRAAFDHDATDTPFGTKIFEHEAEGQRIAGVDDYGGVLEPVPGRAEGGSGAVDQARRARGEEAGGRVQVAGRGEGDPDRVRGQAAGGPAGAAARVPDQQPRVVRADRVRADHDGVAARPFLVHPVQVGGPGQDQPPRAGVVQVAVGRRGTGQQDVRTRRHEPSVAIRLGTMLYWSNDA